MTYVALAALAVVAFLAIVLVLRERDHERLLRGLLDRQRDERAELTNRLQFPKIYQPTPSQQRPSRSEVVPNSDLPEMARVGTVIMGEEPDDAA